MAYPRIRPKLSRLPRYLQLLLTALCCGQHERVVDLTSPLMVALRLASCDTADMDLARLHLLLPDPLAEVEGQESLQGTLRQAPRAAGRIGTNSLLAHLPQVDLIRRRR